MKRTRRGLLLSSAAAALALTMPAEGITTKKAVLLSGPPSSFSFSSIPGLALWLRASDYASNTWTDRVSGIQYTNATPPTLSAGLAVLGGKPAVTFNGSNQRLTGTFNFSGSWFTVIMVARQTTLTDAPGYFGEGQGSNGAFALITGTVANGSKYGQTAVGTSDSEANISAVMNQFDIITWRSAGAAAANQLQGIAGGTIECLIRVNGVTSGFSGGSGYPTSPSSTTVIGALEGGAGFFNFINGQIAEILVFKGTLLSNYQIMQVEQALATYYGLTYTARAPRDVSTFDGYIANSTPVLTIGVSGFDSSGCNNASAVYNPADGKYYVAYVAYDGTTNSIGLASGTDPRVLTKNGQILTKGAGGQWDSSYVSGCRLYYDPTMAWGNTWILLYFGSNVAGFEAVPGNIGFATASSPTGPWTKFSGNPILSVGAGGTWDARSLYHGFIVYYSGTWYIFYNAANGSLVEAIGSASATNPQGTWTKNGSNPLLQPTGGSWDAGRCGDPFVLQPDPNIAYWVMFYLGGTGTDASIGSAYSTDLVTWTKYLGNWLRIQNVTTLERLALLYYNGNYLAYADD